ncbi:hypothetical protein B0H14DRAFT_2980826 [Mycena olivaceomarginata]|nr:hypothetical protein B0H14DRAFT_2980826 [Mycena olivaceomarginata]
MTYDNVMGIFSCTNVLEEQRIDLQVVEEQKDFEEITNPLTPHPQSDEPENDRRRRYYSSDWAFRAAVAAVSKNSQYHILHRTTVVVVGQCRLSDDMRQLIGRLPPWSREEQPKYTQFFKNYGTHVITQLESKRYVFRDGGASAAAELTAYLEQHFPRSASSSGWKETREKWIQALEKEPFGHLTSAQRADLASAYREYVASPPQNDKNSDRRAPRTGPDSDWLQRDHNFAEAVKDLLEAVTQALYRLGQGR